MKMIFPVTLAFLLLSSFTFTAEPRIVRLTPPKISPETISEKITCDRPKREDGKFKISSEVINGKTIVHCYGHGGAGWTTLFGSVEMAIDLLKSHTFEKGTPIRVIGAGCMGLTAAIELKRQGYNVVGIYAKELYDLPSWKAAGYFAAISGQQSQEERERVNRITHKTFLVCQMIERGEHAYLSKETVRQMPVYSGVGVETGLEGLEAIGAIPQRENVTLDFGNGVIHTNFVKYLTYFMNTSSLMLQLISQVNNLDIPIEIREIQSFDEIEQGIIFNCTGLGARELNADASFIPLRGHLVTLNASAGTDHMDYMIYTIVEKDGKRDVIYLFPKNLSITKANPQGIPCSGVLGGSVVPHADRLTLEQQKELDQREFKRLLDRNSQFFQGHIF